MKELSLTTPEEPGRVLAVVGSNFSGRTEILKTATKNAKGKGSTPGGIYVGPEIYNCISGLASSVSEELRLHSVEDTTSWTEHLGKEFGLDSIRERNPFTLSGGEQVLLAVACALGMKPGLVAVDCALEQLDHAIYDRVVAMLEAATATRNACALLADNRFAEHLLPPARVDADRIAVDKSRGRLFSLHALNPAAHPPPGVRTPCSILVENLSFQYGKKGFAIRNVSFVLDPGSVYVLAGTNGAGKSTLAKLLCGVLRPTGGNVRVDGVVRDLHKRPGRVVGYHFQNPDVQLFETSVKAELFAGAAGRVRHTDASVWASFAWEAFGLKGVLNEHPLDLPFVLRKRVALAATLAMGTPWLILDEPTLGQDDATGHALAAILLRLCEIGIGIVIISHSPWFRNLLPAKRTMRLEGGTLKDA